MALERLDRPPLHAQVQRPAGDDARRRRAGVNALAGQAAGGGGGAGDFGDRHALRRLRRQGWRLSPVARPGRAASGGTRRRADRPEIAGRCRRGAGAARHGDGAHGRFFPRLHRRPIHLRQGRGQSFAGRYFRDGRRTADRHLGGHRAAGTGSQGRGHAVPDDGRRGRGVERRRLRPGRRAHRRRPGTGPGLRHQWPDRRAIVSGDAQGRHARRRRPVADQADRHRHPVRRPASAQGARPLDRRRARFDVREQRPRRADPARLRRHRLHRPDRFRPARPSGGNDPPVRCGCRTRPGRAAGAGRRRGNRGRRHFEFTAAGQRAPAPRLAQSG